MTDWIDEKAGELAGRCECAPYDPCQRCSLADALREAYARGHIQGGCDLAIALGYSTGHADTFEDLRANVEAEDAERRKLPEDAEAWVQAKSKRIATLHEDAVVECNACLAGQPGYCTCSDEEYAYIVHKVATTLRTALAKPSPEQAALIERTAKHWLDHWLTPGLKIPWEGGIDAAMKAATTTLAEQARRIEELEEGTMDKIARIVTTLKGECGDEGT